MRPTTLFAALVFGSFAHAPAQELPVQPGQQVRVTAPSMGLDRYVGEFTALRDGNLVVTSRTRIVLCPLSAVSALDARTRGRPSAAAAVGYGLLGGLVGALVGGLVVGVAEGEDHGFGGGPMMGSIGGAFFGFGVGLAAGSSARVGREWVPVPLGEHRVGLATPPTGGIGLSARIAF